MKIDLYAHVKISPFWARPAWAGVLFGTLIVALAGCGAKPGGPGGERPKETPAVRVAEVTRQTVPIELTTVGNVEAFSTVSVRAQVSGELTEVHFTEGDFVKKDQVLFTIDTRPFDVQLRQAEAALARARAQREQASATLARDRAQAENARREHARNQPLLDKQMISQEEFDQTKTQAEAMDAAAGADEAAVKAADQAIQSAQADIDQAKLNLDYCTIRSPLDGRTGSLLIHQGNLVKANDTTPMVIVTQVMPIYVTFAVPEKHLATIRESMAKGPVAVTAALSANDAAPASGVLSFVDNAVDESTGTIRLKGLFENTDQKLWPGQFVSATIVLGTRENVVVAPSEAVQMGQSGYFSYVVNPDSTVEVRDLVTGELWNGMTIVEKGLEAGDRVIVDGLLRAAKGAKVNVMNDTPKAEQTAPAPDAAPAASEKKE